MTMVHHAQTPYGTVLDTKTWISRLRRQMICTREVRARAGGVLVAAATQDWVHVDFDTRKPTPAAPETAAAFRPVDIEPSVAMPDFEDFPGDDDRFSFQMWQTWADALAHANHPAYVGWCDEATSRRMDAAGVDPVLLHPIAERVHFRCAVLPGEWVSVRTARIGVIGTRAVVLRHWLTTERGPVADATTVRGLADDDGTPLIAAWG